MGTTQEHQLRKVVKFATPEQAAQASIDTTRDDYKRIIYSEVYAPMRPDTDNMYMTAEDIEEMAYKFLSDGLTNQVDLQHNNELQDGCAIVESFIARAGDPTFNEGAWVVGIRILNDAVWDKVLKGEINGFSVEALVYFEDTELLVEESLQEVWGHTTEDNGHSHKFYAKFDEFGTLIGGETDIVDGHKHLITTTTVTRLNLDSNGVKHRHKFSSVDNMHLAEP